MFATCATQATESYGLCFCIRT